MKLPVVGGLPQTGFQPLSLGQSLPSLTYHSQITAGSQQEPAGDDGRQEDADEAERSTVELSQPSPDHPHAAAAAPSSSGHRNKGACTNMTGTVSPP